MMILWGGSILVMGLVMVFMAMWWGETRPCHQCIAYKRRQNECDSCSKPADVYYCATCIKRIYKKRTPRVKRFLKLLERIKKIRHRRRKNK